ncbi:ABC transporter ATP-binding protein [Pseudonocardia acaciae]|uniref:ABC transporter ATP-binding protein n=1 Tax=Pseudonocardia acaciae TaxID=551276 RepID=UPI001B80D05C|nr:ABC transporter ATP-binding protein [Pseudonocardia acaciae]
MTTVFDTKRGEVAAVTDLSYELSAGETLGIVGESGSGKSVSAMSILGLVPRPPGRIVSGEIMLNGRDLVGLDRGELRAVRGSEVAMIFQDPMSSLNPVHRIGAQIAEGILSHRRRPSRADKAAANRRAVELLESVGVPAPEKRARQYPHQLSGGMRQRVMIAMAMSCDPKVLVADEPTTALDATIQAQIMRLLREVQGRTQVGIILITHDIGLVAQNVDRVLVMYAGRVVETGPVEEVLEHPRHPYTVGLLRSTPSKLPVNGGRRRLTPIPGLPPNPAALPPGCSFAPRCTLRGDRELCLTERPLPRAAVSDGHLSACHFVDEIVQ